MLVVGRNCSNIISLLYLILNMNENEYEIQEAELDSDWMKELEKRSDLEELAKDNYYDR